VASLTPRAAAPGHLWTSCHPNVSTQSQRPGWGATTRRGEGTGVPVGAGAGRFSTVTGVKGHVLSLGETPYLEAWELQRAIAAEVHEGTRPDTVIFLEHPPVVTVGRRTGDEELHVPPGTPVEIVETDRGGKSTFHGPGQLVCYPILDLNRHGRDVRKYCRDLEEALIQTLAEFALEATRIDGLTGVWLQRPPRKIASIGVHISRWVTTHGYALNVDLDPGPFTDWITACGLEDAAFTTMARELGRPLAVDEVRPAATAALAEVFGLELERVPIRPSAAPAGTR